MGLFLKKESFLETEIHTDEMICLEFKRIQWPEAGEGVGVGPGDETRSIMC